MASRITNMRLRHQILIGISLILLTLVLRAQYTFDDERVQLAVILRQIDRLNSDISQIDTQLESINKKITRLENHDDLSWIERRRLVKLTEEKAALNTTRLDYFQQLLDNQNRARQSSDNLIQSITAAIDSTLNLLSGNQSVKKRQEALNYLLTLNELRNQAIDSRRTFSQINNELIPGKINIQDYLQKSQNYPQIHRDLINLLDKKIHELSLMIKTVNEEKNLQNRLAQFSMEMSSVSGEIKQQSLALTSAQRDISYDIDNGYSEGPISLNNRDYINWVTSKDPNMFTTFTPSDYLPVIKSISPSELPDYITTLDSLRNFYLAEKQKIINQ